MANVAIDAHSGAAKQRHDARRERAACEHRNVRSSVKISATPSSMRR